MLEVFALVRLSLLEVLLQEVEQCFKAWALQDFVLLSVSKLGDGLVGQCMPALASKVACFEQAKAAGVLQSITMCCCHVA